MDDYSARFVNDLKKEICMADSFTAVKGLSSRENVLELGPVFSGRSSSERNRSKDGNGNAGSLSSIDRSTELEINSISSRGTFGLARFPQGPTIFQRSDGRERTFLAFDSRGT